MLESHNEREMDRIPPVPAHIALEHADGVTNGKGAHLAPDLSAHLLRAVVAHAPMTLMALDRDGIITLLEGRDLAVWGVAPGALVGRSIFELVPDQPEVAAHARRALAGETLTTTLEQRGIVLETRWTPLPDDAGTIAVSTDITERTRAEQALRESDARQAAILTAIPDLIFRISRAGEYLDVQASQESLLFVPREAIVGHTIDELLPPEVAHACLRGIARTLETGTPQIVEYQLPVPEGLRSFEARLVVSGPDEVLSMVRDTTEHKRAELARAEAEAARTRGEEALRQSEERFRTLIEAAPIAICVMTAQDRFVTVNDAYCALTGYTREELLAGEVGDLHPPEERRAHLAGLHARFAAGRSEPVEFTLLTKQGERRTVLGRGTTVVGQDGRPQRLSFVLDITARKQAEEALRASEQRFRALIEHSFDGIVLLDAAGLVRYRSPSMRGILGYDEGDTLGIPAISLVHPDDLPAALAALADLGARPSGDGRIVYRLRHRDGSYRWVEVLGTNLLAEPAVEALVLNIQDITERRQADELRQRLAAIVETSVDAIFSLSLDGVIESWNEGAIRLFGYSLKEAVGAPLTLLAGQDDGEEPWHLLAAARQGAQQVVEYETVCRRRDGHPLDVAITLAPLRDAGGRLMAVSVVMRDITERKRAEEEERGARAAAEELARLRSEREREARAVAEVGAALAHELEPERLYRLILEQAARLLPGDYAHMRLYQNGWAVVGAAWGDTGAVAGDRLFPLIDAEGRWMPIARDAVVCIDDSRQIPYWVEIPPYTGERRAGSTLIVPIIIDGEAIGSLAISSQWTGTYTDHHVRLASALGDHLTLALRNARLYAGEQERARGAEELARLRSDFVAAVSHELRTPLTSVVGYAELLLMQWDATDEPTRRERVARISASAARQQRLIEDLLLSSQIEAGYLGFSPLAASLADLVRQAVEEVAASYAGQRIDVDGMGELAVAADPARAVQVLVNLLDNAAKYSPEGSPVAVSWRAEGGDAVVRVRDCGSGVPEEGRAQLFTRFGRLRGSRMRAGRVGTGLGLYLGRELARAMGGELDLEETGPDGSTFRLRLPLAQPATQPPPPS